jgi:phage-related protein
VPTRTLVAYREADGSIPLRDWFVALPPAAKPKCAARLEHLEQEGHRLRRPIADVLEDGIYELRARHLRVQFRMLYFFHGPSTVVVTHGFVKRKARVPRQELALAKWRRRRFEQTPEEHTYRWSLER